MTLNSLRRPGTVLVTDHEMAKRLRAEREASDAAQHDEVWDGVYIMSPMADTEHMRLCAGIWLALHTVVQESVGGDVYNGVNVSDLDEGWVENFREPDVAVVLDEGLAHDRGTHLQGGPDIVVEVLSPNDLAREKLSFYGSIGVREVLIVDRYPWALELYSRSGPELSMVGRSSVEQSDRLSSSVLPITFRLVPSATRPQIEVVRESDGAIWLV
jgi:Uma2 family endonuclease